MTPVNQNLSSFVRGDTHAIVLNFQKNTGTAEEPIVTGVSFEDWEMFFTLKYSSAQPDSDAVLKKQMVIGAEQPVLVIEPGDTSPLYPRTYYYDVQIVSPEQDVVMTLATGQLTLLADVTQTID